MKHLFRTLALLLILVPATAMAQENDSTDVKPTADTTATKTQKCDAPQPEEASAVVAVPEEPASYPGGEKALLRDFNANIVYPAVAMENGIQGRVVVKFTIDERGAVTRPIIVRSLSRECDAAAVKAVLKLRRFTPARSGGKAVKTSYTVPVTFRLQ